MARETQYGEFRIDRTGRPVRRPYSVYGIVIAAGDRDEKGRAVRVRGSLRLTQSCWEVQLRPLDYGIEVTEPAGAVATSRRATRVSPWPARAMRITVTPTPKSVPQTIVSKPTISQEFSPGTWMPAF